MEELLYRRWNRHRFLRAITISYPVGYKAAISRRTTEEAGLQDTSGRTGVLEQSVLEQSAAGHYISIIECITSEMDQLTSLLLK